jgi:hypothetical protein
MDKATNHRLYLDIQKLNKGDILEFKDSELEYCELLFRQTISLKLGVSKYTTGNIQKLVPRESRHRVFK